MSGTLDALAAPLPGTRNWTLVLQLHGLKAKATGTLLVAGGLTLSLDDSGMPRTRPAPPRTAPHGFDCSAARRPACQWLHDSSLAAVIVIPRCGWAATSRGSDPAATTGRLVVTHEPSRATMWFDLGARTEATIALATLNGNSLQVCLEGAAQRTVLVSGRLAASHPACCSSHPLLLAAAPAEPGVPAALQRPVPVPRNELVLHGPCAAAHKQVHPIFIWHGAVVQPEQRRPGPGA